MPRLCPIRVIERSHEKSVFNRKRASIVPANLAYPSAYLNYFFPVLINISLLETEDGSLFV